MFEPFGVQHIFQLMLLHGSMSDVKYVVPQMSQTVLNNIFPSNDQNCEHNLKEYREKFKARWIIKEKQDLFIFSAATVNVIRLQSVHHSTFQILSLTL